MSSQTPARSKSLLVIGGGISGMTTAIEAAEVGREVFLVERDPYLGGRVARTHQYFPKMCPPTCGLEINFQRIRKNPRIHVLTDTVVRKVDGEPGAYTVTLRTAPQYVLEGYGLSGEGADKTPEVDDAYNLGLKKRHALHIPHPMAFPMRYHIAEGSMTGEELQALAGELGPGKIDPAAEEKVFDVNVGAIVVATGWKPYDAKKLDLLGFGTCPDVVTNAQMERMAAAGGPTEGKILRPSNGEPVKSVAFVQCAGSRDENHLPYCSSVCCLASMKQALYVREKDADAMAEIFYIDLRAPGRNEDFLENKVETDEKIALTKGKVAEVTQEEGGKPQVVVEDVYGGGRIVREFDLVVLAVGVQPEGLDVDLPGGLAVDENGFALPGGEGIFATGMATAPRDVAGCVQESTGAAIKALIATT